MKDENNKDKKFWIHPDDFDKIIQYAQSSYSQFKAEIAGQLMVVEDKDGDFILKNPVILKQTVSGAECDLDAEELAIYYSTIAEEYGTNVRHCWWHSHHTMDAFWSGTDNSTILNNPSKDFTVSLVINLKREYKLRIQFFKPFLHEENVTLNFLKTEDKSNPEIDAEVKKLCQKETAFVYSKQLIARGPNNQYNIFNRDDDYGGYGNYYNHYSSTLNNDVDLSKLEANMQDTLLDEISALTDNFYNELENKEGYKEWNKYAKRKNQEISKYNIKLIKFKTNDEFETATMRYWPEDYIHNIKKEKSICNLI